MTTVMHELFDEWDSVPLRSKSESFTPPGLPPADMDININTQDNTNEHTGYNADNDSEEEGEIPINSDINESEPESESTQVESDAGSISGHLWLFICGKLLSDKDQSPNRIKVVTSIWLCLDVYNTITPGSGQHR